MDLETGAPLASTARETYRLKFTGDGGVYMGVWLVNLLLTVVTLALYTPVARRRTLKYFYAHTVVAGSPLEFTGGLRRMVFGFLLFFGWYVAYSLAINTEQDIAGWLLGGLWVAISPWIWMSAVRFRLHSTRWRGIQGRFTGTSREAYVAHWPLLLLAGAGGAAYLLWTTKPTWTVMAAAVIGMTFLLLLVGVLLETNYTRVRLLRAQFAGLSNTWTPRFGQIARLWAIAFGMFIAIAGAVAGVVALGLYAARGAGLLEGLQDGNEEAIGLLVTAAFIAFFAGFYFALGPALAYREAGKFRLVWNHVALGDVARFESNLDVWAFVRLRLRNMVMTLLTFGFWRPFTVTSEYQRKLESVSMQVEGSLDALIGQYHDPRGAVGDAIADAVGFDAIG